VSVNTRFQIPPKKKSHVERSGERGGHGTSSKREMRCRETCFEQWALTGVQCALWHHLAETTHWHSPPPRPTYWVLPIQEMSGSRGSPCMIVPNIYLFIVNSVYRISCCPHPDQVFPKLPTPYTCRRLSRPGMLCCIDWYLPTFRTTCPPHLQGPNQSKKHSSGSVWPFKMGPIGCLETSVTTILRCVTSQKSWDLIYTPVRA